MQLPRDIRLRRLLGLGPALGAIGIFMVVPMLILLVFSFLEADPYGGVEPVISHVDAYIQLLYEIDFDDTLTVQPHLSGDHLAFRSVGLALVATVGLSDPGLSGGLLHHPAETRACRTCCSILITLPFWTNQLVRVYSWILILAKDGVIEQPLEGFVGILDGSLGMMYSNGAIAIGLIYTYLPLMVLPIYASLEKLDFRLIEAAHDLYAGRFKVAREIIVPLAMPGIIAGCILVFVPSLGAFVAPDLLGGGKKLMLGSLIQLQFSSSRNWPFGSAIAVCLLALVMISLIIQARSADQAACRWRALLMAQQEKRVSSSVTIPGMNLWTLFFFTYLYAPMIVLVIYAFNDSNRAQIWKRVFEYAGSTRHFPMTAIQDAALNSLIIAVLCNDLRHNPGDGCSNRHDAERR